MLKKLESLLAGADEESSLTPAPAALRSRIYSAVVREAQKQSPLRPLSGSMQSGYAICAWENLVRHLPGGETKNHCALCPARKVAEASDRLSIPWSGCPYRELHCR